MNNVINGSEEAKVAFQEAIEICDKAFPIVAGAFRGSLALLQAQKGQFEEAQLLLDVVPEGGRTLVSSAWVHLTIYLVWPNMQ